MKRKTPASRRQERLLELGPLSRLVHGSWLQGLLGRSLERRANGRAAAMLLLPVAAAIAALIAIGPAATIAVVDAAFKIGEALALVTIVLAIPAILYAATWLALSVGGQFQWPILTLIAGAMVAVMVSEAQAWRSVGDLSRDYWMLAPFLFAFALPFGFALHPTLPFRSFLLAALITFALILPDYLGFYTEDLGTRRVSRGFVIRENVIVEGSAEDVAAFRASGIPVTWLLLCLGAVWSGLAVGPLWRRLRGQSKPG